MVIMSSTMEDKLFLLILTYQRGHYILQINPNKQDSGRKVYFFLQCKDISFARCIKCELTLICRVKYFNNYVQRFTIQEQ